jgi:hypothetical protein
MDECGWELFERLHREALLRHREQEAQAQRLAEEMTHQVVALHCEQALVAQAIILEAHLRAMLADATQEPGHVLRYVAARFGTLWPVLRRLAG